MSPLAKILVPTDFSDGAGVALVRALQLRQLVSGKLTLLHIYELPVVYANVYPFNPDLVTQIERGVREVMERTLKDARARARQLGGDQGPPIDAKVFAGTPSQGIVDEAKDGGYDLIVMGTHGRRGLSHLLIGSVAERVVRTAPCAVMTIRGPAER
jgi:nucleotide-binding universal stress UspA family protein